MVNKLLKIFTQYSVLELHILFLINLIYNIQFKNLI